MSDIKDRHIFDGANLVSDVSLIKVMVVKKKFVEQMERWWDTKPIPWGDIEIIGISEQVWIVFKETKTGKLWRVHRQSLAAFMQAKLVELDKNIEYKVMQDMVEEAISHIPQLFLE